MVKILVVSDSHGCISKIKKLQEFFKDYDYVFHLGDFYADMNGFRDELGDKLYAVKGNCDLGGEPIFVNIEGVKIMAVHGNKYHVKSSLTALSLKAREENCNLVLFGHTHNAEITIYNGITFVNPGNLTRFSDNTYAEIDLDNGAITAKITKFQVGQDEGL